MFFVDVGASGLRLGALKSIQKGALRLFLVRVRAPPDEDGSRLDCYKKRRLAEATN